MAYFWDNSITAESTEDFCSQVFIKMFITTVTMVAELCTHFLERKKGTGKKMCLERTFPRMPQEGGRGKRWSSGISKPVSSDAGMTTQEALEGAF